MAEPLRVFIADDHEVVRRGLRDLLTDAGFSVVGEARHGWQVINADSIDTWDVLLLDLSLPRLGGPEVLRRIKERRPELPVVVLSMYPPAQYAPALLAAGAAAYLSKDESGEAIVNALRAAAAGCTAEPVASAPMPGRAPHLELSSREQQIFMMVTLGRSVGEIAVELNVRSNTVSTHLAHIREKLGVRTLGEILTYAFQVGLIERPLLDEGAAAGDDVAVSDPDIGGPRSIPQG